MSGMWLRRLEVKDLAGIASAVIDLKPGVNVLCGPNELGKSSLVRGIRAALLLPSAAAAADELRDWHVDAPPYVSLTIEESPGRVWRIQKRFGGGQDGSSLLEFSKNGNDFHLDARGREVDGKLHSLLQWGVPAPGGKGRRGSGLPDSFLVTVLLGDQNDVVAVLGRSLDDDADDSAKSRLTAALQALAEDPRYKQVLEQVQEKVDSAFTPAGKRKTARGSVWKQASDELRNAERLEAELREQLAESESAHIQVERLRADLQHAQAETDDARRTVERLRRDLERKRALVEHTQSRDVASREVERIKALRRLVEEKRLEVARATAHADNARQTLAARQIEKGEAEQRRDLALARVRELETGAAEQQRRLREQEAEKEHLRLTNEKSRLSRIEERTKEVKALVDAIKHDEADIATLHASVSEKNELLQKAQESSESNAMELASLRQCEVVARYRSARDKATAAQKRKELGQDHRRQADLLESQAEEVKARVARAALPDAEQIARLRDLDTQLKVAEGRASVSMVATLIPELNATVIVSLDGQQNTRVLEAGAAVELHFTNELQATLPGFGRLKVRGEQADVLRDLQTVREAFMQHRETYGKARLLLADEVGVGKTLSLAASAMISVLLDDGAVLILCPSTLTLQWQVELLDKLGIPSAVWSSTKKVWLDPKGHVIRTRGAEDVGRCPFRIAIVSTGLIFQDSEERRHLIERRYGTVILDEAHKARRRGGFGDERESPNNLLDFMLHIGPRTKNLLLGTATPIQTEVHELWDLLRVLNAGADHVLGRELFGRWPDWQRSLPVVKGEETPVDERDAWEWLRNPLPPATEDSLFTTLRLQLGLPDQSFFTDRGFGSLGFLEQQALGQALAPGFLREHNPVVRHTVLRRRETLENAGLLEKVGVDVHPEPGGQYSGIGYSGLGLLTNLPFDLAYQAAEAFTLALSKRTKAAGFMKTLLLQRICSSFASGRATAERMLRRNVLDDEEQAKLIEDVLGALTAEESKHLQTVIDELSRPEARDPKVTAVRYFLTEHRTEGKSWLEHGCIVFSQYYDTVRSLASGLAELLPNEAVGVYAGAGKSGIFRGRDFASVEREDIKAAVKERQIRLIVATDAACEGLNLQTLGTLINVDLPWNPSRLEQRLGRIKRFGQARRTVDMLNLVYHDTQDEKVYQVISRRMKDRYDIFGGLPDTIEDDWIQTVEELEDMMDDYIHLRKRARDVFELRYQETINPDKDRWELCSRVLSRSDVIDRLSVPW